MKKFYFLIYIILLSVVGLSFSKPLLASGTVKIYTEQYDDVATQFPTTISEGTTVKNVYYSSAILKTYFQIRTENINYPHFIFIKNVVGEDSFTEEKWWTSMGDGWYRYEKGPSDNWPTVNLDSKNFI